MKAARMIKTITTTIIAAQVISDKETPKGGDGVGWLEEVGEVLGCIVGVVIGAVGVGVAKGVDSDWIKIL